MSKTLEEIAVQRPHRGIPDDLKQKYYEGLKNAGRKTWRGLLQVGASGFGKGALITIAATLAVMTMIGGSLGYAQVGGLYSLEGGVADGLSAGIQFLMRAPGMLLMAIGGTLGAIADVRKEQGHITAEVARAQAQHYEIMRGQKKQPQVQAAQETAASFNNPKPMTAEFNNPRPVTDSFERREMQRRMQSQSTPGIAGPN